MMMYKTMHRNDNDMAITSQVVSMCHTAGLSDVIIEKCHMVHTLLVIQEPQ